MILWTIQTEDVYNMIMETGVYRCDFNRCFGCDWKKQYDWLVLQMIKRIGKRTKGVTYPVWAWYQWEDERKKPDLRRERWGNGWKGDVFYCMEIDIPDKDVLLSDFDLWSIILNNGLISYSEEEDDDMEKRYNSLSKNGQKHMMEKNWERVFDLLHLDNGWIMRGSSIQATFWELRREQVVCVQKLVAAKPKPAYLQ